MQVTAATARRGKRPGGDHSTAARKMEIWGGVLADQSTAATKNGEMSPVGVGSRRLGGKKKRRVY